MSSDEVWKINCPRALESSGEHTEADPGVLTLSSNGISKDRWYWIVLRSSLTPVAAIACQTGGRSASSRTWHMRRRRVVLANHRELGRWSAARFKAARRILDSSLAAKSARNSPIAATNKLPPSCGGGSIPAGKSWANIVARCSAKSGSRWRGGSVGDH